MFEVLTVQEARELDGMLKDAYDKSREYCRTVRKVYGPASVASDATAYHRALNAQAGMRSEITSLRWTVLAEMEL